MGQKSGREGAVFRRQGGKFPADEGAIFWTTTGQFFGTTRGRGRGNGAEKREARKSIRFFSLLSLSLSFPPCFCSYSPTAPRREERLGGIVAFAEKEKERAERVSEGGAEKTKRSFFFFLSPSPCPPLKCGERGGTSLQRGRKRERRKNSTPFSLFSLSLSLWNKKKKEHLWFVPPLCSVISF